MEKHYRNKVYYKNTSATQEQRNFIRYLITSKDFFFAFKMAYPDRYEHYNGNRIRCIRYFKNHVANDCFVKELTKQMLGKKIDLNDLLPVKIATETTTDLMTNKEVDDKVRAQVSLAILGMAIEVNKSVNPTNATAKQQIGENPFIEDAKFIDVQDK